MLTLLIVDHGVDSSAATQEEILQRQAYEKAVADREVKEKLREAEVSKLEARCEMVNYFSGVCAELASSTPLTGDNINYLVRKFKLEQIQFDHKLPMYARKKEFLRMIRDNQAVVVKGGTGTGKTLMCLSGALTTSCAISQNLPRLANRPTGQLRCWCRVRLLP